MAFWRRRYFKVGVFAFIAGSFILLMDKIVMPYYVSSVRTIEMPNLIGLEIEDAMRIIDSLNLKLQKLMKRHSSTFPAGQVIMQSPRPGMFVKEGRRVYLTISAGEEKVMVPSLRGKSLRDAKFVLEKFGLKLGNVEYDFSYEIPENAIASQSIPENTRVPKGTEVSVVVSLGTPEGKVKVPNLIGVPLSKVERYLNEVGLKVGKIIYEPTDLYLPNTVLEQFPRPGTYIPKGSPIDIFVAKELPAEEENINIQP